MTATTFRAPEVCALTGVTYRQQLDYWAKTDLVRPSVAEATGSGSVRRYSAVDVAVLRVVNRIISSGPKNNLELVRRMVPTIRALVERGDADVMLVITVDGEAVIAETGELLALVQVHGAVFVITGFDLPVENDIAPIGVPA